MATGVTVFVLVVVTVVLRGVVTQAHAEAPKADNEARTLLVVVLLVVVVVTVEVDLAVVEVDLVVVEVDLEVDLVVQAVARFIFRTGTVEASLVLALYIKNLEIRSM